jgi:hypothetical protein
LLGVLLLQADFAYPQSEDKEKSEEGDDKSAFFEDRIVTPEDIGAAMRPRGTRPFLVIGWPFGKLLGGMEKGLISFEKNRIRQKIYDFQQKLGRAGFRPLFGGMGEGSGIGVGTVYQVPPALEPAPDQTALQLLGRMSFLSGYQELSRMPYAPPRLTEELS